MNPSDPPPQPPPPPPPDPKPPLAHRVDSGEADRLAEQEVKRRQRLGMLIVLFAVLLPIAGCGFLFAVCSMF